MLTVDAYIGNTSDSWCLVHKYFRQGKGDTLILVTSSVIDTSMLSVHHKLPLYLLTTTGSGGSKGRKILCIYVSINSSREIDHTFIYSAFQDTSPRRYI